MKNNKNVIIEKPNFKKFEDRFKVYRIREITLKALLNGDCDVFLWNTSIKAYPVGFNFSIDSRDWYNPDVKEYFYNCRVYALAYFAGKIVGVTAGLDGNYDNFNKEGIIHPVTSSTISFWDSYDEFPSFELVHELSERAVGGTIFDDAGGTGRIAYEKAKEKIEKDIKEKSKSLIELEKRLSFKTPSWNRSDEVAESSFMNNEEVMKLINNL